MAAITPSSLTTEGKEIEHFTCDVSASWTTTAGSLFTDAAATIPYVSGSRSDIYLLVQNKTSTGVVNCGAAPAAAITITGVFPSIPHFPHDFKVTKRGIVATKSRSGKISGRIQGDGNIRMDPKLRFNLRNRVEFNEVKQFVDDHFPGIEFYYSDGVVFSEVSPGLFVLDGDPPMSVSYESSNRLSFEVPLFMV